MKNRIKGSIALKTFIFTSLLIITAVAASFGFLCLALPEYYTKTKLEAVSKNSEALVNDLKNTEDMESIRLIISEFVTKNNANVMAFNSDGGLIPVLSTPLVSMEDVDSVQISVRNAPELSSEVQTTSDEANTALKSDFLILERSDTKTGPDGEATPTGQFFISVSSSGGKVSEKTLSDAIYVNNYVVGNALLESLAITATFQPVGEATVVIMKITPYILMFVTLISLLASYIYAKGFTAPILKISAAALKMSRMEPDALSQVKSNDELGKLSENLDNMYTELLSGIESLKLEMEKVNRLEKSKADFMRSAGHELKTPIAALMGITDGMLDNIGVYKDKDRYLKESKALINKLSVLVNEILNASKADNAFEQIELSLVNPLDIINEALTCFQPLMEEKQLSVSITGNFGEVVSNYGLMYYSISNVISNAANYSLTGGEINVVLNEENGQKRLSIENTAQNIPEELLPKLFEPFYTPDYSRDKNRSGTGLGLYIVKNNLDRLGCAYEISNTVTGVKFVITFPQI